MSAADISGGDVSRRRFLAATAASAGLLWRPLRQLTPFDDDAGAVPPGFPKGVRLYRTQYENWAGEIRLDDVWSAEVHSADDIVNVVNWAAARGWKVRPSGARHGWSPFTVTAGQPADTELVIIDTITALHKISVDKKNKTLFAQAGALLDDIMVALEDQDLGFTSIPAPGAITIAGALAINGHGAAIPAKGEDTAGRSYGSLSNRIVSLKAIVFDEATNKYAIKTFDRSNPITKAMLTSLGRVFVTSVVLRAEKNTNLRCISTVDVPSSELFAKAGSKGRTFASYVDKTGRVEAILFPFTDRPWLKYWSVEDNKPAGSRKVTGPYNYPFSDNVPVEVAHLGARIIAGRGEITPSFGNTMLAVTTQGLTATNSHDIWGSARNSQHYIKPTTLRAGELGHAIITSRANIQRAVHEFVTKYHDLVNQYQARGLYPANMPIEIRCNGIDDPSTVGVPGAEAPALSASAPVPSHPEWDVAIFVNSLSLVGGAGDYVFKRDLEQWIFDNYSGDYATVRVEWSKGWGYTDHGGWSHRRVLDEAIPNSFPLWEWTTAQFKKLDPHNVFTTPLLERLTL